MQFTWLKRTGFIIGTLQETQSQTMALTSNLKNLKFICRPVCRCTSDISQITRINGSARLHFKSNAPLPLLRLTTNYFGTPRRYFFKMFRNATERDLKIKDNVPVEYNLIYRNTMTKYIYATQFVTCFTAGIACLAFMFNSDIETYDMRYSQWSSKTKTVENEEYVFIFAFIFVVALMQVCISRLPLRIYKVPSTNETKYLLICPGNLPLSGVRVNFSQGELNHVRESGILPWKENRYLIKADNEVKRIILIDHYFRRPADLNIMLGEQRDPEVDKLN